MQIRISETDTKAIVGYLEAYTALMKEEQQRMPTTKEINYVRRAIVLKRKLERKISR